MEDVDNFKENCEENSILVYVDSSKRELQYYPFPGEYTIQFDQPFKNVYGFEVLDGAIPNTMYNVDIYNNDLYFTTIKPGIQVTNGNIAIGYFNELKMSKTFMDALNSDVETFFIVANKTQTDSWLTVPISPSDIAGSTWYLLTRNYWVNPGISPYKNQISEEFFIFDWNNSTFVIENNTQNQPIIDILSNGDFSLVVNANNTIDLVYYDINMIPETMYQAIDSVAPIIINNVTITNGTNYLIRVSNFHQYLAIGNTDVITIVNDLNDLLTPFDIGVETTTVVPKKEGKLRFFCNYPFILNCGRGALPESLGFDIYPAAYDDNTSFLPYSIGDNSQIFLSVYDAPNIRWIITSPGLINLLGERFVILRVPEIEDHIYASYSYMDFTPGIGMFKMGASGGSITNLRFDFTTIVRKAFHPIGKLSKITLRWETKSGMLYDFKGVNHQVLFTIKCYSVKRNKPWNGSIINPNYNPDIMQYLSNNKSIQYHESSDDESSFDDDYYYKLYNKHLEKLDYSSSDSGLISPYVESSDSDQEI